MSMRGSVIHTGFRTRIRGGQDAVASLACCVPQSSSFCHNNVSKAMVMNANRKG